MWQRVTPHEGIGARGVVPRNDLAISIRPLAKMVAGPDEIWHFAFKQEIGQSDDGCGIRLPSYLVMRRKPAGTRVVVIVDERKEF